MGTSPDAVSIARAFTDAVNAYEHEAAAALLAEDAEVVSPGGTALSREAWLESRRGQEPRGELSEEVVADELISTGGGVELRGRLVQRWTESGEVADELPVRIAFAIDDGVITHLELRPA